VSVKTHQDADAGTSVGQDKFDSTYQSSIERWNGSVWKQVPSLGGILIGVAATSGDNAWAVGSTTSSKNLILRWNGTAWKRMPSPALVSSTLCGVAATSASDAWAVGGAGSYKTVIERWNGKSWTLVPSPAGAGGRRRPSTAQVRPIVGPAVQELIRVPLGQ
jgi:hypothetical protein